MSLDICAVCSPGNEQRTDMETEEQEEMDVSLQLPHNKQQENCWTVSV